MFSNPWQEIRRVKPEGEDKRTLYESTSDRHFTFEEAQRMDQGAFEKLTQGERLNLANTIAQEVAKELGTPEGRILLEKMDSYNPKWDYRAIAGGLIGLHLNTAIGVGGVLEPIIGLVFCLAMLHFAIKGVKKRSIALGKHTPSSGLITLRTNNLALGQFQETVLHEMKHFQQTLALKGELAREDMPDLWAIRD